MIVIYNIIRFILYIIILFISLFSKNKRIFFTKRFNNKMITDLNRCSNDSKKILIHLSSVGELNLSEELINSLLRKGEKIIISITTDTGMSLFNKRYSDNLNIQAIYFPLDDYFLLRNLFIKNKIKKVIIIETEIWPNLFYLSSKYSTLYMVNARLTDKSLNIYLKIKWIIKHILKYPRYIMVQGNEDLRRYNRILSKEDKLDDRILKFENLKYTIKYPILDENNKKKYYDNYVFDDKKVIVCGSIREGEEIIWIDVFNEINVDKKWQLILVPRHLDRISEIKEMMKTDDFSLFSEKMKTDILIIDKIGILRDLYQLSSFAFIGGTLVNIGGHSILEPLFYNKKPIIGKYYENIKDIVEELKKNNMVSIVKSKEDIIHSLLIEETINSKEFFDSHNDLSKIIDKLYE